MREQIALCKKTCPASRFIITEKTYLNLFKLFETYTAIRILNMKLWKRCQYYRTCTIYLKNYEILFDGHILKQKDMGWIWISPGGLGGYKKRYD